MSPSTQKGFETRVNCLKTRRNGPKVVKNSRKCVVVPGNTLEVVVSSSEHVAGLGDVSWRLKTVVNGQKHVENGQKQPETVQNGCYSFRTRAWDPKRAIAFKNESEYPKTRVNW